MSYTTVRNEIISTVSALKYIESTQIDNYQDASANEYGNTFILNAVSGELNSGERGETLVNRFYDDQEWELQVAFERSNFSDSANRDRLHRERVKFIRAIDDCTNWANSVRVQRYASWEVQEFDNYLVLVIIIQIIDTITY